jgi:hypothetical protein
MMFTNKIYVDDCILTKLDNDYIVLHHSINLHGNKIRSLLFL